MTMMRRMIMTRHTIQYDDDVIMSHTNTLYNVMMMRHTIQSDVDEAHLTV